MSHSFLDRFAKRFLSLLLFLLLGLTGTAQERGLSSAVLGINGGVNHSSFNFYKTNPQFGLPGVSEPKLGASLGLVLVVPFHEKFALQPEYIWNYMGGVIDSYKADYQLNYFSLPVLLRWQALPRLALVLGPQFDLLINGKVEQDSTTTEITKEIENRGINATVGVEYSISDTVSLNGRFVRGLNHIGFPLRDVLQEYQNQLFQLSFIYYFPI